MISTSYSEYLHVLQREPTINEEGVGILTMHSSPDCECQLSCCHVIQTSYTDRFYLIICCEHPVHNMYRSNSTKCPTVGITGISLILTDLAHLIHLTSHYISLIYIVPIIYSKSVTYP